MHKPMSQADLDRIKRLAKAELTDVGTEEEWRPLVQVLCDHIREVQADFDTLSRQLQIESEDRQMHAFNARYWEELYQIHAPA